MEIVEPITPLQKDIPYVGEAYNKMVEFINESIYLNRWHDQHFPLKDDGGDWNAILLNYDVNKRLMDDIVEVFTLAGWDCKWQPARDARGPHKCFYINKSHFNG